MRQNLATTFAGMMDRLKQVLKTFQPTRDNHQALVVSSPDEQPVLVRDSQQVDWRLPLVAVSISATALVATVREIGWLQGWELQVYDHMVRVFAPRSPDPRIVVVTIGESEYPQKTDANILKAVNILQANQARVIGLNLYLPESNKLSQAIANQKNLLVTCFHHRQNDSQQAQISPPPGFDVKKHDIGFSDLIPDQASSPILRRAVLFKPANPQSKCGTGYSFAALAAIMHLEPEKVNWQQMEETAWHLGQQIIPALTENAGGYKRFDSGGFQTLISYRHPRYAFAQISLQQLLNNQFSRSQIADKLVLIGVTATSIERGFYTPFTGDDSHEYNRMPPVFIHAQIISHLLDIGFGQRQPIWYWSEPGELLWILLWSTVGAVVALRIRSGWILMISGSAIAILLTGICYAVFSQGGWIPLIPPLLGLGFSGLGVTLYQAYQNQVRTRIIILQVEKQQQAIAQLNALLQDTSRLAVPPSNDNIRQTGDLLLGGRYQITRVLASGGFGCTYLAKDNQRPGTPTCVVKQLMPARRDPKFLEVARRLFAAEAEILQVLGKHNHIPNLLAYLEENQEFYLVQEYIPGRTLEQELHSPHPEAFVINLVGEILEILKFVHSHRVIHRDIKPGNIIRCKHDNRLVLIDFGAVKTIQPLPPGQTELATVAIGTRGYAPPEQLAGHPRLSSDIYAVGMIGIQALTGLPPQDIEIDPDTGNLKWSHLVQVSPEFAQILEKMTSYHFGDRYLSANDALADLRRLV
ncbi:serine/threonine protein kinase with Chase2 sensor [Calothrix sp. NIES-3974]|nr:serine/threonine protein kinase with Chase2 sensor [Calothrix sp. NIES-3974]